MKKIEISAEAHRQMQHSPYNFPTTRWAIYQNQALDSSNLGHCQFIAVGPQNTFKEPPERLPDTNKSINWAYRFVGWVK